MKLVVEWFVKHAIKVWSVNEGEQRFESHVDKLMNYIRFWQASGESEKTSMHKKMIISQLVSRIEIGKGYKINVELNMDYEQFCEDFEVVNQISKVLA